MKTYKVLNKIAVLLVLTSLFACTDSTGDIQSDGDLDVLDAESFETLETENMEQDVDAFEISEQSEGIEAELETAYPVTVNRLANGEAVSDEDITAITKLYLDTLKGTRYFDVVKERMHGWPQSANGFWFGTYWSGVSIIKDAGKVTYFHRAGGADNNGMRTAPMLESACYAAKLWGQDSHYHLARKIMRGFISWILAMERGQSEQDGILMTRAHYPESVQSTDDDLSYYIDYSQNRPGEDNSATSYVHIPDNPYWGDIYIKNMRSKDDIGHMLQAIALLEPCVMESGNTDFENDYKQLMDLYGQWCRRVIEDDFGIITFDKEGNLWIPDDDLAHIETWEQLECNAMVSLQLCGFGNTGEIDCGNGVHKFDSVFHANNSYAQIERSYHESGASLARFYGDFKVAGNLLSGLAVKIEAILDKKASDNPPDQPGREDTSELIIQSANMGLPLTWREVRYLHDSIKAAHDAFLAPERALTYKVFDPQTPDGTYAYNPNGAGFFFRYLGSLLGSCASPYRHPDSKPLLDCELVSKAMND